MPTPKPTTEPTPVPDAAVETTDTETTDPTFTEKIGIEYSQYRARGPLAWFGAAAFKENDLVPASHPGIPLWVADGSVERIRPAAPAASVEPASPAAVETTEL